MRQVSELLLARRQRWQPLVPRDQLGGMVVGTVMGAGTAHLPLRRDGGWIDMIAALHDARPIAAAAVAVSMRLPHTTVRRQANGLVATGHFERHADGFRVTPVLFGAAAFVALARGYVADLHATLAALSGAGYAPAAPARAAIMRLPDGVVERLLLKLELRAMETFVDLYGDIRSGIIFSAVIAANIRHITADPVLARRYAGEAALPPDALRVPIGLRALARAVDLPFETVRRRVAALTADGAVALTDAGVVVPTAVLCDERYLDNNRRIVAHFEQMLDALVALARVPPGG